MRKGQLNSASKNMDTSKGMGIFIHAFGRRGRCLWKPWMKALGLVGENYILSWWWGTGSTLLSNNTIPPPNVVLREERREDRRRELRSHTVVSFVTRRWTRFRPKFWPILTDYDRRSNVPNSDQKTFRWSEKSFTCINFTQLKAMTQPNTSTSSNQIEGNFIQFCSYREIVLTSCCVRSESTCQTLL
jgi:hypothetical protein